MGPVCLYSEGLAEEELVNEVHWKQDNFSNPAIYFTSSYLHGKTT